MSNCFQILKENEFQNSIPSQSLSHQFSSVQSLSRVQLFATPWTAACQASQSITNSQSLLKLMSIKSVMPSNHPSSVVPFSSCLQSFPESGSFPVSQFFSSGGQSIGSFSFSIGLSNEYSGLISFRMYWLDRYAVFFFFFFFFLIFIFKLYIIVLV